MRASRRLAVSITMAALTITAGCARPPASAATEGWADRGPITFVAGKDDTGYHPQLVARWNAAHPDEPVRLIELPAAPDDQRQQMMQNAQLRSDAFTVLEIDSVWVPEFAAHRWITDLPADRFDQTAHLTPAWGTGLYRGRLVSAPASSDGAMLYYRKDLLDAAGLPPPTTWAGLRDACAAALARPEATGMSCYAGQFEKYEGLTANLAEVVSSAGGAVVDAEGRPTANTPEALRGLNFLVDGFRTGLIPRDAIAFKEPESRRAFQEGRLVFSRWWPGQWAQLAAADGSSAVAGRFEVAPLPGLAGPGVSNLGGHNLSISPYGKNKATALDFIRFRVGEAEQREFLRVGAKAPTLSKLYDEPELRAKYPYLPVLKAAIATAAPRPRVVPYGQVSQAIQDEAYAALTGAKPAERALADMQARLLGLIQP